MIVGIHHVAIGVPDFDAGLKFYTEVLGFEQVEQSAFSGPNPKVEAAIGLTEPTAKMAMLRGGNAHIELWQYEQPPTPIHTWMSRLSSVALIST